MKTFFLAPAFYLSVLLFFFSSTQAQFNLSGSPFLRTYTKTEYRGGTQNWVIRQGLNGMIYIGNNQGLLEFDGIRWNTYPLPNQTILRSLAVDSMGILFVGGQGEFGFFEPDSRGQLQYHSLISYIPESAPTFDDVWQVFQWKDGVIFMTHQALFFWDKEKISVLLPHSRFENAFIIGDDILVQDWEKGLMAYKEEEGTLLKGAERFAGSRISAILPFPNSQRMLVATENEGLFLSQEGQFIPWNGTANAFLIENNVYTGILLKEDVFAFGTTQNGLLVVDTLGNPLYHLNKDKDLNNNTVLSIFQDAGSNLWLGLDNGIAFAEIQSPFSRLQEGFGIEGTAYAAQVFQGSLYLGTNQGLYFREWPGTEDPFRPHRFKPVGKLDGQVWDLEVVDDDLWVGHHRGAFLLNKTMIQQISSVQGAWKFQRLKAHPGYAVEGTYSGFVLYKEQNNQWDYLGPIEGFSESSRIFEEDEQGNLWVSHFYKGVFKLELSQDLREVAHYTRYGKEEGLPEDIANQVAGIRNELVFATPKGVYSYDKSSDRFLPHEVFNRLFGEDTPVRFLKEDELGNIWFSAGEDFGQILIEEEGVYNQVQKRILNKFRDELVDGFELIFALDAQHILIGTEEGFVMFLPEKLVAHKQPFFARIGQVMGSSDGKDTLLFGGHSTDILSRVIAAEGFPTGLNSFHFSFYAPFFSDQSHLQYKFYLEGFESSWTDWTPHSEKEYTNLDPGAYTFWVKAMNSYGTESEVASYSFSIAAPWYATNKGKAFFVLLGIFGLTATILLMRRRYRRQNELLRDKQAEELKRRDHEFQEAKEKSQAEIIRLRNEKLRAKIQYKNQELASSAMHLVQKTEMLNRVKNELKQLSSRASAANKEQIRDLIRTINADIRLDDHWEQFEHHFDQVHEQFIQKLRENYPDLTPKDLRLCAYLRMNLATKEIAPLMNISVRGVEISRYRLRKKLNLDNEENLVDFMLGV